MTDRHQKVSDRVTDVTRGGGEKKPITSTVLYAFDLPPPLGDAGFFALGDAAVCFASLAGLALPPLRGEAGRAGDLPGDLPGLAALALPPLRGEAGRAGDFVDGAAAGVAGVAGAADASGSPDTAAGAATLAARAVPSETSGSSASVGSLSACAAASATG